MTDALIRCSRAQRAIADAGYTIRFVERGEDAETPGFPGQIRGATNHERRDVKIVATIATPLEEVAEILEHELHHVEDPSWDCGNRDVFGRGGPSS